MSVQEFFNIVKEIMKRESDFCQDKYIWFRNILVDIYFSKLLQYDVNLTKDIVRKGGSKKRKSMSKRRKIKSKKGKTMSKKRKTRFKKQGLKEIKSFLHF
jgi:hypothetical protein